MNLIHILIKWVLAFGIPYVLLNVVQEFKTNHAEIKKKLKLNYLPLLHNFLIEDTPYHKFKPSYNETYLNLIEEPTYCQESDIYKLLHPDIVLEDKYIFRDIEKNNLQREIIKKTGYDAIQGIIPSSKPTTKYGQKIPIQLTYFYTYKPKLQDYYHFGTGLGCLFQKFNHIPGTYTLISKNQLIYTFNKYIYDMKKQQISSECIKNASYVPETFRLNIEAECKKFFNVLKNTNHTNGPEFLLKTDEHRGEGIRLLFKNKISNLTEVYNWGQSCGQVSERIVAQKYINRPFLYKQHKIEFRIYLYIASTRPLQVYMYKRALIKRCASEYNPLSEEISAHICNTAVTEKTRQNQTNQEIEEQKDEEEELFIDWDLDGIQKLLIEEGRIDNNTDWLNDYLYPKIQTKVIHMIRSGQNSFIQDSRFAEFLAIDFLLDDDLDIWLLEINYNPQVLSVTEDRIARNYKMIGDTLEIAFNYLKSKFYRIQQFIQNDLMIQQYTGNRIRQTDFNKKYKSKMYELLNDKLHSKFKLSQDNLYQHIIDENLEGYRKYFNVIKDECL